MNLENFQKPFLSASFTIFSILLPVFAQGPMAVIADNFVLILPLTTFKTIKNYIFV